MNYKLGIIGAGGHAASLLDCLTVKIDFCVTIFRGGLYSNWFDQVESINDDEALGYDIDKVIFINGIGENFISGKRKSIFEKYKNYGYRFYNVIDESAIFAHGVELGEGVQLLKNTTVNSDSKLGNNVVLNSGSIVEHGCRIGHHSFVGPGVIICGDVHIGINVKIGAGAIILPGCNIESNTIIPAGSLVKK